MIRVISIISFFIFFSLSSVLSVAAIIPAPPKIKATAYLVMDYSSRQLIVAEKIDEQVEPASLTKLMTVYVATNELLNGSITLEDKVRVSEKAWRMPGSRMFIEVDKEVTVEELLKGIIIQSGNDASVALAEYISGSEEVFVEIMNQYAAELGMTNTHFMNSTGLPHEQHYTTARDMATLAAAVISERPDIYAWYSIKEYTFNGITQHNRNQMLWRDETVDGMKTGHTESAGYCLVASAKRGDMRLISVVMGTDGPKSRTRATQSILNFAFRFYETHKLYEANEVITTSKVWKGDSKSIDLGLTDDLVITIPRGKYKKLDAAIEVNSNLIAPISQSQVKGTLKVSLEGEELVNRPLITLGAVAEGSFFERIQDEIKLLFQ